MTTAERDLIAQLSTFMRDWRQEDQEWKRGADQRLRTVESQLEAAKSIAANDEKRGISNRAKLGIGISAAAGIGSLILQVIRL